LHTTLRILLSYPNSWEDLSKLLNLKAENG